MKRKMIPLLWPSKSGDTISFSWEMNTQEIVSAKDMNVVQDLKPVPLKKKPVTNTPVAIFITPTVAWGEARARELNYEGNDYVIFPISSHLQSRFHGIRPDEEGEPIVYLSGTSEILEGLIDTPEKRKLRNTLKHLEMYDFEVIDLDEAGYDH